MMGWMLWRRSPRQIRRCEGSGVVSKNFRAYLARRATYKPGHPSSLFRFIFFVGHALSYVLLFDRPGVPDA